MSNGAYFDRRSTSFTKYDRDENMRKGKSSTRVLFKHPKTKDRDESAQSKLSQFESRESASRKSSDGGREKTRQTPLPHCSLSEVNEEELRVSLAREEEEASRRSRRREEVKNRVEDKELPSPKVGYVVFPVTEEKGKLKGQSSFSASTRS